MLVTTHRSLLQIVNTRLPEPSTYWTLDNTAAGYIDVIGGLTLTAGGTAPTNATGIINDGSVFGGSGFLSTPNAAALQIRNGFTVAGWLRPDTLATLFFVDKGNLASGYAIIWNATGQFQAICHDGTTRFLSGVPGKSAGQWYHVVTVYAAGQMQLYVNTVLENSLAVGAYTVGTATLNIGQRSSGVSRWNGRIDEIGIWHQALTVNEITALYNGGLGRRPY